MIGFFVVYGIVSLLAPILIIGAIVYLIARRRNGSNGITAYQALITYFYVAIAASVITATAGIAYLALVAFTKAYDGSEIADDLTLGLTLLGTGSIICILHVYGRRAVEKLEEKATTTLRRVYLFFMLAVFGIGGIVSLPVAINETVHYYVDDSNETSRYYTRDSSDRDAPSEQLAAAIVLVPMWTYYVFRVLREVRQKAEET
jgi:hypothetical protein